MRVLCIDPGASGGLAVYDDVEDKVEIYKMPETPISKLELLEDLKFDKCYIEKVGQHMQGNSASSSVKLGRHYGELIGLLTALRCRFVEITAVKWMNKIPVSIPKGRENYNKRKTAIWDYTQRVFPDKRIYKYQADAVAMMIVLCKLDEEC